jgi:hypothetical protein
MANVINHTILRGSINTQLKVDYKFYYKKDDKYPTIRYFKDTMYIEPSFSITIGEPYGSPNNVFITNKDYFPFVLLLKKSIELIQQHLSELFPNLSSTELEIDSLALESFMTSKAMRINGMTIYPTTWSNQTNETFPAILIETKRSRCRVPLEDGLIISQMLSTFDPNTFGIMLLNMMGP